MLVRRQAAAALAVLALAGCGTTVPLQGTTAQGPGDGLSATTGGPAAGGTATGSTGAVTAPGTGGGVIAPGGTGSTTGSVPATTSGGGTTGVGLPTAGTSGRGFTATTIKIGYATADDYGTFVGTLGLQGLDAGDPKAQMRIVVDVVNKRGGIGGRKIVLVPHNFNTAQLVSDPNTANQAACATWTQDNPVYAVVLPGIPTTNLLECLKKKQTPVVNSGLEFPRRYAKTYSTFPDLFHISSMVGERYDTLAVSRLVARNYFEKWDILNGKPGGTDPVRVGVIVRNDDEGPQQTASVKRALAAHGITPYSIDQCPSTINAASCMQNVELRYQAGRVTHVFGNSDLNFMNLAESQHYRPRYFMPGSLDLFAQNAPAGQLSGAMGESFLPTDDVPATKDPGPPTSATTSCINLMRKNGQDVSTRTAMANMQATCDVIYFLEAAIKRVGALSDGALHAGLEALGTSQPSAVTWSTRLAPDQHAGTSGLRDLVFDSPCRCFVYTSRTTWTK